MMKRRYLCFSVCVLSLLSACSDEEKQTAVQTEQSVPSSPQAVQQAAQPPVRQQVESVVVATQTVAPEAVSQQTNGTAHRNIVSVGQTLKQQSQEITHSLSDLSSTLEEISQVYENDLKLNQEQVNKLAGQLGKLARQAGESARTLETTTQTLGEAIQQGFEEGYHGQNRHNSSAQSQ